MAPDLRESAKIAPVTQMVPPQLRSQPFLLREARRLGLSKDIVRGPGFRRVLRGVYVAADVADSVALRAAAARLLLPVRAVFSHRTAAELLDLPLPTDGLIHTTIPRSVPRTRVAGLVTHQVTSMPTCASARLGTSGLPITAPARTFLDVAASLTLVNLVVLGDAMVRRGLRPRVDSPMETHVRLLIVLAGRPCPEAGGEVLDEDGQWIATVDLQYRAQRIAIEYDGLLHLTSRRKWLRDLATRDLLRDQGWEVIVLTSADVFGSPLRTLRRIRDKLAARGHPQVPEHLDPGWEDHLPSGHRALRAHDQAS